MSGGLQDHQAGEAVIARLEAHGGRFAVQDIGEAGGLVHRLPLGQADQDVGDVAALAGQVDAR